MNHTNSNKPAPLIDGGGGGIAAAFTAAMILVAGIAYPVASTLLDGLLFRDHARGSLLRDGDRVVGSALVAQPFAAAKYFVPRTSAAGYDPMAMAGSNWAPGNPALRARIAADSQGIAAREGVAAAAIPPDLVTASGSGLDPHITPEAAALQVPRVARVRGLSIGFVQEVVAANSEAPTFGVLGAPRVNVLLLNRALDAQGHAK